MPSVAAIVLNWNGLADTRVAVRSLLAQTFRSVAVWVVDNASAGPDAAALAAEFGDRIHLVRNAANLGFPGGHNGTLRHLVDSGSVDWIALLNNDAIADPAWIERLVAAGESDPRIGACASLMVFRADASTVENAGVVMLRTGEAIPRGRGRPAAEFAAPADVAGACFGAVLLRTAALREVGLMRDDFFLNFEDVDLSLRLLACGWRIRYVPDAVVRHGLNQSIDKVRDDAFRIRSIRNMSVAWFVNLPWQVLLLELPWTFASWVLAPIAALLLGQPRFAKVLLLGRLRTLRELPALLRDRRALAPKRRASWWSIWRMHGSSLAAYGRFVRDVVLLRRREPMK